ncbi:MAG: hypothetical protein KC519_06450 [Anaerolineae bacterium]|nr:hypothetical protein [Anaerolineae bacterium]
MTHRRKANGLIGILILLAVVVAGGVALAATGNLENPLRIFSTASGGEGRGFRGGAGVEPPAQAEGTTFAAGQQRGAGFEGRGGGEGGADAIQWSQIGSVLYDVWVILAVTTLVVIIGTPLGRAIKWLRQRRAPVPAP